MDGGALIVALCAGVAHPLVARQHMLLQIPENGGAVIAALAGEAHLLVFGEPVTVQIARGGRPVRYHAGKTKLVFEFFI